MENINFEDILKVADPIRRLDNNRDLLSIDNRLTNDKAFKISCESKVYASGAYNSNGADYAEMFEWADGNPNNEDRVGYFITFEEDSNKIRKANDTDKFILGVISTDTAMIGDSYADIWKDKYVRDEWDRIIYDKIEYEDILPSEEKEGVIGVAEKVLVTNISPRLNPDWDNTKEYIPRENRKEWAPVGLLGKLLVKSDGSCKVGKFCKPNAEGIATISEEGYYVLEIRTNNIIKVLVK